MEIGSKLRQAREEKGLTLQQAEEETKIRRKYIDALESEKFEILPGPTYVKAFIRTYAKYLGLNGEELVEGLGWQSVAEEVAVSTSKPENDMSSRPSFSWKPRYWAYLAAVVLVGAIALFGAAYKENSSLLTERNQSQNPPQHSDQVKKDTNKANNQSANEDKAAAEKNQKVDLTLKVTSDQSWVLVKVDGNTAFEGILPAGQSKKFTAQENVWFKLGNTGAVQVLVNGENHGYLGKKGTVNSYTVDKSSGKPSISQG